MKLRSITPDPLRVAAQAVVAKAELDDSGYDGECLDYHVPIPTLDSLRAALAADTARPGLDVSDTLQRYSLIPATDDEAAYLELDPEGRWVLFRDESGLDVTLDAMSEAIIHRNKDGSVRNVVIVHGGEEHSTTYPDCPICKARAVLSPRTIVRAVMEMRPSSETRLHGGQTMSEADSDSRITTIIDAATGDQWRVPTRAFEAIIAAFTTARPRLDAETLACAMEQFYSKAEGTMLDSAAAIAAEYIRLTEDRS